MRAPNSITIYTDGSCLGNPGKGGWAFIILEGKFKMHHASGFVAHTTNNQMELQAVAEALALLKTPHKVLICTDSQYVVRAFNDGMLTKWQHNGWRTAKGDPVKNKQLWEQLIALTAIHQVTWQWVQAHKGESYNEFCDSMANNAAYLQESTPLKTVDILADFASTFSASTKL